jgi:hypothetical protein
MNRLLFALALVLLALLIPGLAFAQEATAEATEVAAPVSPSPAPIVVTVDEEAEPLRLTDLAVFGLVALVAWLLHSSIPADKMEKLIPSLMPVVDPALDLYQQFTRLTPGTLDDKRSQQLRDQYQEFLAYLERQKQPPAPVAASTPARTDTPISWNDDDEPQG